MTPKTNLAYRITRYPVGLGQFEYIKEVLKDQPEPNREFFRHVLAVNLCRLNRRSRDEDWVPMYCLFVRKNFRNGDWSELVSAGLLEYIEYSKDDQRCRQFRVPDSILQEFQCRLRGSDPIVCLITEKRPRRSSRARTTDENRNAYRKLIKDVMSYWRGTLCPYNQEATNILVDLRRNKISGENRATATDQEIGRYLIDHTTFNGMKINSQLSKTPGLFHQPYSMVSTGRFRGSFGPIVCTKTMTRAIFHGMEVHNYDISASQDAALQIFFQLFNDMDPQANLNIDGIRQFAGTKEQRQEIATRIGIDVPTLKVLIHALKMGAEITWRSGNHGNAVYKTLCRYVHENHEGQLTLKEVEKRAEELVEPIYWRLVQETQSFRHELTRFHNRLRTFTHRVEFPNSSVLNINFENNKLFIRNACECLYQTNTQQQGLRCGSAINVRRFTAFLLQGLEASFIHHLTILGSSDYFDFSAVANLHDGLVTLFPIDEEAINLARERSGFSNACLIEKPLECSSGDEALWSEVEKQLGSSTG